MGCLKFTASDNFPRSAIVRKGDQASAFRQTVWCVEPVHNYFARILQPLRKAQRIPFYEYR
jgi:hypothetical protein